jgi:2-keto-4-pentenoate hydratase
VRPPKADRATSLHELASRLRAAYEDGAVAPLRDLLEPGDVASAYAVQDLDTLPWQAAGRRINGRHDLR